MERRESPRSRRRIPCEFQHRGDRYRGIAVNISRSGLFIQTDATLEPGAELEVSLLGNRFDGTSFRTEVVRRRATPPMLASLIRPGLGVRIVEAPDALFERLGGKFVAEAKTPTHGEAQEEDLEIEIVVCDDVDQEPPPPLEPPTEPAPEAEASALEMPEETAPDEPPAAAESCDEPEPAAAAESGEEADEPVPREPLPCEEEDAWPPEALYRSEALLIDDGELDDVHAILEELGVDPVRRAGVRAEDFHDWEVPPRVVVVSARAASRLTLTIRPAQRKVVRIAVAEAESQTLLGMLRRQGFDYVVRRPIHPEALRLLLMTALYRGSERRSQPRRPFGCEIGTRWAIRRRPATLLEISGRGCRFLGREMLERGTRVSVRIPGQLAGGRGMTLRGRVQRSQRRLGRPADASVAVALRFETLSKRKRERLEALLANCATGPPALPRTAARPPRAAAPAVGAHEAGGERRRAARLHPRARFDREVVVLDAHQERARQVLFARDLSVGGVRVDPHPDLEVGHRFGLVLYDATYSESVVVDAEVLRDDGTQGLALRFLDVPDQTARKIRRILERVGEIERCESPGESHSVIVAEVVEEERA